MKYLLAFFALCATSCVIMEPRGSSFSSISVTKTPILTEGAYIKKGNGRAKDTLVIKNIFLNIKSVVPRSDTTKFKINFLSKTKVYLRDKTLLKMNTFNCADTTWTFRTLKYPTQGPH